MPRQKKAGTPTRKAALSPGEKPNPLLDLAHDATPLLRLDWIQRTARILAEHYEVKCRGLSRATHPLPDDLSEADRDLLERTHEAASAGLGRLTQLIGPLYYEAARHFPREVMREFRAVRSWERAEAEPEAAKDAWLRMAEAADEAMSGKELECVEPPKPAPPADVEQYVEGGKDICARLKVPYDKMRGWRRLKYANENFDGPITYRGNKPVAEIKGLVEWWEKLQQNADAATQKRANLDATKYQIEAKQRGPNPHHANHTANDLGLSLNARAAKKRRRR